ncbi:hypothetical protein FRX31_007567 [Thalictrum thalictroides]|uniref:RING-type domain-containing protein n=1 Tax=Thalictrum thalictroides TaxID=46969 RepID=A0A7J6WZJ8_THATH|nr:hypothetical protein FRX31_007567 [Thalictrum thalictroides]
MDWSSRCSILLPLDDIGETEIERGSEFSIVKNMDVILSVEQVRYTNPEVYLEIQVNKICQWITMPALTSDDDEEYDDPVLQGVENSTNISGFSVQFQELLTLRWQCLLKEHLGMLVSTKVIRQPFSAILNPDISTFVHCEAQNISMKEDKPKNIKIVIQIGVTTTVHCDEEEFMRQVENDTMDINTFGCGVPATPSSIEALETMKIENEEDLKRNCGICMEEFLINDMVKVMPCSHVFRGRCIVMWLARKNTCPLCRFKMPTANV